MNPRQKAVCLISGGLDSTVAMAWAAKSYELFGLHISYGQRAAQREKQSASDVAAALGASEYRSTTIGLLSELGGSALTDESIEVPSGVISTAAVPVTQVPFRNGIFLAMATAWAEALNAAAVVIGAVEEDSSGYPDCREQFLIGFERAVEMGIKPDRDIRIVAPLVHKTKGEIVKLGIELDAPFHLSWSCYKKGPAPCGQCESCLLRTKGFEIAGICDPLTSAAQAS